MTCEVFFHYQGLFEISTLVGKGKNETPAKALVVGLFLRTAILSCKQLLSDTYTETHFILGYDNLYSTTSFETYSATILLKITPVGEHRRSLGQRED